ncbi:MAG: 23S rRNA (uracil(1939)-C(5))-methyltransferase RlmD [Clostridiaceae bacterium]|uniref:23S rRNA (Uracil(1939)-C(5))-methyltransferase RlmD n=1 Tax=Clostridium porci TaxID=2605778 RepID=A0A7X2TD90_9CLOT|nr:23S rRNA (uracil(1939)-C(5))-methyltransferase RlmD [Clostridiaceae bacterium]MSS37300.1 23S rRNA (uracil(1939)-C(5))-methyltransferase RlmD [Clostridium porci]
MKKGEIFEGVVETIEFPNKGILHIDGERVVVKNAILGQRIQGAITKQRKGRAEGRVVALLERSPLEIPDEACPHFGICGGCIYQSLPYKEQLKIKENQVKSLLDSVVENRTYEFQGIKGSPQSERYRNKMEFSFGDEVKDGPLALGLHKRSSFYDIVTTQDCRIVHTDFCQILEATREYFARKKIAFYKKLQHKGYLRHLLVRRAVKTGEILVDLITSTQREYVGEEEENRLLEGWKNALLSLNLEGTIAGILHTENDSMSDSVQDDRTQVLYGQNYFYEELLGLRFRISPFSFFQTNSMGAEVLYETVRSFVGETKDKVIFDLYSGTGTIAQILAPVASKVVGVELIEEAVEAAKINAGLNGLSNCEFLAGDVLRVIDELEDKPDVIVVDPPRDGIHPKALGKIGSSIRAPKIIYISCKPTSLIRDLAVLQEYGYEVRRACCVDMFPGTYHVETVVLLSQQKPDDTIEIDLDLDELDATSAELKATYQEIKDYVLKEFGLKVSSLYISQIKRKCGIEVGENYNLPKSENARVPQCPKEKEDAIKAALKYFAMI